MKKIICIKCNNCRKFQNPKISYIFDKTLLPSFIFNICSSKDEKIFKEANQFRY